MRATGHGKFQNGLSSDRHPAITSSRALFVLLLCGSLIALFTSCARLQLPAIDPNGSSIFLPLPNTTQLVVPHVHDRPGQPGTGFLPTPAFATPATPPPCLDASGETPGGICNLFDHQHKLVSKVHDHFRSRGKSGEIQLTPVRVVAPVGGEVVLLAGICGKDGYLVKREPLEWMLSPDSVGQFIEVGDDSQGLLAGLVHHKGPKVEKLDVDFARGRTSSQEQLITRGTRKVEDDIKLREGETWLSVSSPSEGVSRVTVLAPDSDCWDQRRQTATIYWVDAEWQFPPPQVARSGEIIQLVSRVTKSENLVPATDWIVKYTILDPNVATFTPATGSNESLVRVNNDGQAIAQITAPGGARGTTPVMIQVIRPAQPADNLPELELGRGQTMVTFSSPGLNLEVFGPSTGAVGEQLTYAASLGNPGDIDTENVSLRFLTPAGTRVVAWAPAPSQQTDNGLIWEQGLLPANRQLDISVVLEAQTPVTFDANFSAVGAGGLSAQKGVRTEIIQPSIDVRFAPANGVAQAEVGQSVQYEIVVTNNGRQTLTDVRLLIESEPGLPEAFKGQNRVEQTLPLLQPGESRTIGVQFIVQQVGQLAAKLTVSSGNAVLAERSTSILGQTPRPKQPNIGVSIQFPESILAGTEQSAVVTLRNPGEVRLSGLKVELTFDPELEVFKISPENYQSFRLAADGRSATWSPQDLLPRLPGDGGDMIRRLQLSFRGKVPVAAAAIRVRATAAEGVQAEDIANVRIEAGQVEPPPQVTPPAQARTGGMKIELDDLRDPTIVGLELRYALRITNDSNQADRNVQVEALLPPGVQLRQVSTDGNVFNPPRGAQGQLQFPVIQFMRPGDSINYILVVIPQVPQSMVLRARTMSDAQLQPVEASATTTVYARNQQP